MYMLDTNICIYILKKRPLTVFKRFENLDVDDLCISIVTYAELQYGVEKSIKKRENKIIVNELVSRLLILSWDEGAAMEYGKIRAYLDRKGNPIGNMDLLIASHAKSNRHTLVTNNLKEFKKIPQLKLENWV